MQSTSHKKSIIQKTMQVGLSTLASRFLGIIREILTMKYLGVGAPSDAFIAAFSIPNSLRKVFAEGAISGAFIPTLVQILKHDGRAAANRFMTMLLVAIEGFVLALCIIFAFNTETILYFRVPGFNQEQLSYAVPLLKILIFFILLVSTSAILGGALQAVNNFFIPSLAPVLYNIVFILSVLICIYFNLSFYSFAYLVLFSGLAYLLLHVIAYIRSDFRLAVFNKSTWPKFKIVLLKFFPVLFAVSISEINYWIDSYLGSYLDEGSVTLIYYAYRFIGIPLGVFAAAFSIVLLPYFSRISSYAPKRLSFFMFESTKFIFYITIPMAMLLAFFSYDIFQTLFQSEKFTLSHIQEAAKLLSVGSIGLFFLSLNKILLNIYYALNNTWLPTIISIIATLSHLTINLLLMPYLGATGLILASSISSIIQTILFILILKSYFNFNLYINSFLKFLKNYFTQLIIFTGIFYLLYKLLFYIINLITLNKTINFGSSFSLNLNNLFIHGLMLWAWVGPLILILGLIMLFSRKHFGIKLYFLD